MVVNRPLARFLHLFLHPLLLDYLCRAPVLAAASSPSAGLSGTPPEHSRPSGEMESAACRIAC